MGRWHISSRVAITGLVGLLALDVVLVGAALRSTHTSGINTSPVSSASASTDSTAAPGSPSTTVTPAMAPLQTMLVAVDNQRAWRVGAGSCSAGGATLATTADGGRTWAQATTHLRRIVRVRPADGQVAFVVGANASCAPELENTSDGGVTWVSANTVGSAWFRHPTDPGAVRAPGPSTSHPCGKGAVLDLAVLSTGSARVLCADGLVRSTTDTGSSWTDVGTVAGAVALAVPSANPGRTYVARLDAGCAGVSILRVGQKVATSCIRVTIPKDPGQIALSLVNGGGWLAVGNTTTVRSSDDLLTWHVS
jgi:photosystem II stability/assembly factor-like uncharacterized protein